MSKYTLTYEKDKSQEICIEGIGKDKDLYFQQEYNNALKLIKGIIDLQENKNNAEKEKEGKEKKTNKKYGYNNRILFTGQRGCGKTSVMRSLADYLENPKELKYKGWGKIKIDTKFCCLPMVDPSHFDNNNNILLTVITSMFSEAKKKMNGAGDKSDTAYREDLLKQFEKVFKSLDSIKSELSSYTLESLNRKSDAEDLRDKMNELVEKYLNYLNVGEDSRLVLLIDDIDMSVSHAPEMLEQLRKYLELDNLIILMSANLGQLTNEMREKYSSAFQYTLKDSNQALSIDVEDLATKYLLKLFPTSRRINVERLDSQLLETDLKGVINTEATDQTKPQGNFQKVILSLIWSKTRLLFIPKDPENTLHPIIPTNLRDLAQFLDMLTDLQDVKSVKKSKKGNVENVLFASKKDYDECEHNLQVFKNYVMKTWIPNHLKVDEELVFHNIPSDITEINKHLINSINIIGTKHKEDLMSRQVGLDIIEKNADNVFIDRDIYTMVSPNDPKFVKANKISDIFNQPSNYSYGDLLLMIDKYETYFESEEHRKFTDAIKIYYSILLFETMFFKSNKVKYTKGEFEKLKEEERVLPIQKLIGGTVYYPNYFEIITSKHFSQKGPSFDAKRAFYHKVELTQDKKKQDYIVGDNYPLFSVLYYGDIRPDRYDNKHIYDTAFESDADVDGIKYVTFDILSILSNMLNPWHTINRSTAAKATRMCKKNTIDSGEEYSVREYDDKDFNDWKTNCTIESIHITPNSILPFYSVDIMLQYLNKSILFDEVKNEIENIKTSKEQADYTLLNELEKKKLEELLACIKDKGETLQNDFLNKENLVTDIDENGQSYNIIPKKHVEILTKAREVYDRVYSLSYTYLYSITDSYRDHMMSLVLKDFQGSTKDREQLIKNLHKYDTYSEIFEYLYSVLYKDAFRAKTVRLYVQNAVHSREFVHYYYNKLWNNTTEMLENVTIKKTNNNPGIEPAKVYVEIYKKAIECFVMPSKENDRVQPAISE